MFVSPPKLWMLELEEIFNNYNNEPTSNCSNHCNNEPTTITTTIDYNNKPRSNHINHQLQQQTNIKNYRK